MKIEKIKLTNLRNDEHFQFMTDFLNLVRKFKPDVLKIAPQFAAFEALYKQEDEVLRKITKSALTAQIADLDRQRDDVFRGLADTILAATHHFDAKIRAAGERLQIVMDTYGNVAKKAEAEETSALYNLLNEIASKHQADMELLNLEAWIQECDRLNVALEKLMADRYDEAAGRSDLVLKQVRAQVDEAYRVCTERVDALQVVEGGAAGAPWAAFIADLNAVIERANHIVAQRRGRAAAERAKEEQEAAALAGVDVETWRAMQKAALAAEKAAKLVAANSATAAVVEQAHETVILSEAEGSPRKE